MKKSLTLISVFLLLSALAYSQDYGSIYGTVVDEQGTPLPGVTVTISSAYYPAKSVITSEKGSYRFPRLPIAKDYVLKFELQGFKTIIREKIECLFNVSVRQDCVLEPVTLEEEVTVVAEVPLIDKKRAPVGIHIDSEKLMSLPTARNPWVIMDLAPGVLVSRVDVGGNWGGSQSTPYAHGSTRYDTTYNLDGADMTDSRRGGGYNYYKVSNYEEVNVTYGVNDISSYSGGVQVNIVSKRGGNNFRLDFHLNYTRGKPWERENLIPEWKGKYPGAGLNKSAIYGFSFGGPIVRDKAWFYIAYGFQDIARRTVTGSSQEITLEGGYAKLNLQLTSNTRLELFGENDRKIEDNRISYGALQQSPDTYVDLMTPINIAKIELEQTFGNLLWTTNFLYSHGSMYLEAKNWGKGEYAYFQEYPTFYLSRNNSYYKTVIEKYYFKSIATYFVDDWLGAEHEIKVGADYLYLPDWDLTTWENDVALHDYGNRFFSETSIDPWIEAEVWRDRFKRATYQRYGIFIQDSVTFGRWSLSLGLRYDREKSWMRDYDVDAPSLMSNYLQALSVDKLDPGVTWNPFSPRLSVSYDIFGTGKDIIKLSISRYGSVSGNSFVDFINPAGSSYIRLLWIDADGDGRVQEGELWGYDWSTSTLKDRNDPQYWLRYTGFDPSNPTAQTNPNKFDPDYSAPLKDEVVLSYQKELLIDFAARLELFYSRFHKLTWTRGYFADGHVETKDDYFAAGHVSRPSEGLDKDYYGRYEKPVGQYMGNSEQFQRYLAAQLVLTKRLSHRWMLDASFTITKWTLHYNGDYTDPTNVDYYDGGTYVPSGGMNSRWIAKASGMYQFPYGINLSGSFVAREGFVIDRFVSVAAPGIGSSRVYAGKRGDTRLPNLYMLNLRLEKAFRLSESSRMYLGIDVFNVLNTNAALSKEAGIDRANYLATLDIVTPTVFRASMRFTF
jgi:hypothetical protein